MSITYTNLYALSSNGGNLRILTGGDVSGVNDAVITSADGNPDTTLDPGTAVTFSGNTPSNQTDGDSVTITNSFPGTYTYEGTFTSASGSGIIVYDSSSNTFYALTNDTIPSNQVLTPDYSAAIADCFLPGTLISCPDGEINVEDLKIGDRVLLADGRTTAVKWVGVQPVSRQFLNKDLHAPIRIRAGALGDNLPQRDLFVSPGHAMLVDGVLCNASVLVNGTTISRELPDDDFTYYHVELDSHELIVTEGVSSETYLCVMDRRKFVNVGEYEALYGADQAPAMPMTMPRATTRAQLPQSVVERVFGRSAA